MAVATTTTFAPALKTLWPQKRYISAVYKKNPLLALLAKDEKFTGANLVLALRYSDQQGRSSTLAKAITNKSASAGKAFTLTRAKDYAAGSIETEVILASEDNPGALAKALDTESSSLMNAITRSLAVKVYGDGSGAIGRVAAAGVAGNVITLATTEDISNFEVGMVCDANTTKTGAVGTLRGVATITAVDRNLGKITFNTATAQVNDYLYVDGDYDAPIKGLAAWFPATAPAATAFFGVDRTTDSRCYGQIIDISAMNPEEGLVKALYMQDIQGGISDYVFMHNLDFVNVENALGSKVTYEDLRVGEIGFRVIKVNGPKQPSKLLSDFNCPRYTGFSLQMDCCKLYSLGKAPRILNVDGLELLRGATTDDNELRIAYYAQFGCEIPVANANLALPQ